MLVLRKEIKMGAAIGLSVIGIIGVYGLMASLSGGDKAAKSDATNLADSDTRRSALNNAVSGLPPAVDILNKPTSNPKPIIDPMVLKPNTDPFAESNRNDGDSHNDSVLTALSTGRLGGDAKSQSVSAVTQIDSPVSIPGSEPISPHTNHSVVMAVTPLTSDTKANVKSGDTMNGKSDAEGANPTGKYTVQFGDTFSTIAAKLYGSKKYYAVLVKANPDLNPSRLKIGHQINAPAKQTLAGSRGSVSADQASIQAPIDVSRQYRVESGDTLSSIALKLYGKPAQWKSLFEANKAALDGESGRLKVGTVLLLPQKPSR